MATTKGKRLPYPLPVDSYYRLMIRPRRRFGEHKEEISNQRLAQALNDSGVFGPTFVCIAGQ